MNLADTTHAPGCDRPPYVVTEGHSVTVRRCPTCGAVATTRHLSTPTTTEKDEH